MVYSAELGYDPEEWEECPPPDHFLAFGWFTRLLLAAGAVAFAFMFFYVLERRKTWAREERRASFSAANVKPEDLAELIARKEREQSSSSQQRNLSTNGLQAFNNSRNVPLNQRRPKKRMSEADMFALQEWERELKVIEQRRLEEAKEVDRRAAPSLRASAPPQQMQYRGNGSVSPSEDTPPTFRQLDSKLGSKFVPQGQAVDSPIRAPTPPSTPPVPPIPPHGAQLNQQYEQLAVELRQKLLNEIQQIDAANSRQFQEKLREKHEKAVRDAEANLQKQGVAGEHAAQQFRRTFEAQIDSMVEEYNRRLANTGQHSSNESDLETFEQIGGTPAFYPSESDEPEHEGTSFTYEAPSKSTGPKHTQTTLVTNQQSGLVPDLLVNDQKMAPLGLKKSSSSSEEGFVKIYSDLVEKIDEEKRPSQVPSPGAEAQLRDILQEYDTIPSLKIGAEPAIVKDTISDKGHLKKQTSKDRKSKSKSPHGSQPSSSRHSPDIEAMFPTQPQPTVPVPLVPLAGFQGNFLQQYQQGPDGRLYAQGPDGMFYRQNKKGQMITIPTELQDILQKQQQSGLQQPLIKTTDGNIYQQSANGQFYEQAADGQMYKVPPTIQKLIQNEIQQTLQMGERKSTEPTELVKGPDGLTYERGPLGQFYEHGPDGRLHRVSQDIQRQLLDLAEEQKQESEKKKEVGDVPVVKKQSIDPYQKRPSSSAGREIDPPIIQSPDGKIYELASDGQFYQLAADGRLYRIPHEMQPILMKQHKKFMEQKQKTPNKKGQGSVEEPTPPFDPEYPYHPRRQLPMQPSPNSPEKEETADPFGKRPELKRQQQNDEQTPPILVNEEVLKPKSLDPKDVNNVKELLQEYDLSASIDNPHSHYDQPNQNLIGTPKRDEREHRPSPEDPRQLLQTPDLKTGHTTPDSALDFDLLQMPSEVDAVLRSHPQSPSVSSGNLHPKSTDDLRAATQPPAEPINKTQEPRNRRDTSEQSHKQRAQQFHLEQTEDPRRLVEADIYLQDAIDFVDNSQQKRPDLNAPTSGFVMEEDMLTSSDKLPLKMQNASADPTSRLVPTNEVFEKHEPGFEDLDDAVTFAPDIQTVEIPPDQVSQNSSNYIDNLPDEMLYPDNTDGNNIPPQAQDHQEPSNFKPTTSSSSPPNILPFASQQNLPHNRNFSPTNEPVTTHAPALQQLDDRVSIQHPQLNEYQFEVPDPPSTQKTSSPDVPHSSKQQLITAEERNAPLAINQFGHADKLHMGGQKTAIDDYSQEKDEQIANQLMLHPARRDSGSPFNKDSAEQQPSAPQFWGRRRRTSDFNDNASVSSSRSSRASTREWLKYSPVEAIGKKSSIQKQSSLLSALGCTSIQEMLLGLTSIEELADSLRKAGLERTNLIFGIDYTASNKYQGEHSFDGHSLHFVDDPQLENPYQQVIKIMGHSLAPFASSSTGIPAYGFGDNESGDWGVFPLNGTTDGVCKDLKDVLSTYNEITPNIALGGPTNFAPLIYQAIQICQRVQDYHILVIIADGQVTNERATRKAIVQACQFPLSIIVVGVGDGPWQIMKVFDESLPKRPWDNFHFVEYHELVKSPQDKAGELAFAIHTLLEVPDQYHHIVKLGMLPEQGSSGRRLSTPLKDSPLPR